MSLTREQQAIRARGIGGSEIAAVAGLNPYARPIDVYLRKTGQAPDREDTSHLMRGTHLGPALVTWYEAITGRVVTHHGANEQTLVSATHPLVVATPDGIVHTASRSSKAERVLEAKAPHWRSADQWGEPGTDEIPDAYVPQVIWEMAAAGVDRADVAALIDGDLKIYTVAWDGELFEVLYERAAAFWRDHVLAKTPPPADGSDSHGEYLARRFPASVGELRKASEAEESIALEYRKVRDAREMAEQKEAVLKQMLQDAIGDGEGLALSCGKVTWKSCKGRVSTNYKAIVEELGVPEDLIQKHTRIGGSFRRFLATVKK